VTTETIRPRPLAFVVFCVLGCCGFGIATGQDSAAARADSAAVVDTAVAKSAFRVVTGGPVRVGARLLPGRGKLTVGDQFLVELTVKHPRAVAISEPFAAALEPFVVLEQKSSTRYEGDTAIDVHRLKMAAFATGDLKLPPFIVSWQEPTEVLAAQSDSLGLKIVSVMPKDMKDINDIKPQIPFPNYLPLWILLGLAVAAALGIVGWRLYRRYRRIKLYGKPLPDPWDEALLALDAIPAGEWEKPGRVKHHYYSVSEVLKRYLTRRFDFPALDQTTSEIIRDLKTRKVPERDGFGEFFRSAEMVKYAKHIPASTAIAAIVPAARQLVKATTPAPAPVGSRQAAACEEPAGEASR